MYYVINTNPKVHIVLPLICAPHHHSRLSSTVHAVKKLTHSQLAPYIAQQLGPYIFVSHSLPHSGWRVTPNSQQPNT